MLGMIRDTMWAWSSMIVMKKMRIMLSARRTNAELLNNMKEEQFQLMSSAFSEKNGWTTKEKISKKLKNKELKEWNLILTNYDLLFHLL